MLLEFDLHLNDAKELFVFDPATYDPFDENALGEAGLDFLIARVIGFWFRAPHVRARVFLPAEKIQPDEENRLRRAMQNFCDDLLVENGRERVEFFINNALFLAIAIIVLGIIVLVQRELTNENWIQDSFLRTTFSYGLDVLAWVALWTPVSAVLLDWFPLFRRFQAYRTLKHMELTVQPEIKNL